VTDPVTKPPAPAVITVPVIMQTFDNKVSHGAMQVREVGPGIRVLRGLRSLALWWFCAACAVLIPVLHWVLVPGLTLVGPIMASRAFGFTRQVCGGGGNCPSCLQPVAFPRTPHADGFSLGCPRCRTSIAVKPEIPGTRAP
jgi:hypothetical protein